MHEKLMAQVQEAEARLADAQKAVLVGSELLDRLGLTDLLDIAVSAGASECQDYVKQSDGHYGYVRTGRYRVNARIAYEDKALVRPRLLACDILPEKHRYVYRDSDTKQLMLVEYWSFKVDPNGPSYNQKYDEVTFSFRRETYEGEVLAYKEVRDNGTKVWVPACAVVVNHQAKASMSEDPAIMCGA